MSWVWHACPEAGLRFRGAAEDIQEIPSVRLQKLRHSLLSREEAAAEACGRLPAAQALAHSLNPKP